MQGIQQKNALKFTAKFREEFIDHIVVEEPLEVRVWDYKTESYFPLTVTMRTPGADEELVSGFLFAEGMISGRHDILDVHQKDEHTILLKLKSSISINEWIQGRNFLSTASCGLCGKTKAELIQKHTCYFPAKHRPVIALSTLLQLPLQLRAEQSLFELTGGIHAAGLFDCTGSLIDIQEDIGRHNALDKLIGKSVQKDEVPWREYVLVLSGRIGFELVQKASMLGVPIIVAVGAPSSLAIQVAEEHGITLIGFTKVDRCNIYSGAERLSSTSVSIA